MLDESGERELRELLSDCSRIGELDTAHSRFWGAMVHLCEDAVQASFAVCSIGPCGLVCAHLWCTFFRAGPRAEALFDAAAGP